MLLPVLLFPGAASRGVNVAADAAGVSAGNNPTSTDNTSIMMIAREAALREMIFVNILMFLLNIIFTTEDD